MNKELLRFAWSEGADDDQELNTYEDTSQVDEPTHDQTQRRGVFVTEVEDEEWTRGMRAGVGAEAKLLLQGQIKVDDLSCRETICRMYLQFEDQVDAQAFISAAPFGGALDYHFQSLDPGFDGAGFDESDYTYEVLVRRERPARIPQRVPVDPPLEQSVRSNASASIELE